jgi:hypothetical protein
MTAVSFDTLKLSRLLRENGRFTPEQAEQLSIALAEAFQEQIATKNDLLLLEQRLVIKIERMTIAIGTMIAAATTILAALEKFTR